MHGFCTIAAELIAMVGYTRYRPLNFRTLEDIAAPGLNYRTRGALPQPRSGAIPSSKRIAGVDVRHPEWRDTPPTREVFVRKFAKTPDATTATWDG